MRELHYDIYKPTGSGWFEDMKISGQFDKDEIKQRLETLMKVLKAEAKGRRNDVDITINELTQKSGLPGEFIQNIIERRAIRFHFSRKHAEWANRDDDEYLIRIPVDFGMDLI